MTRRREGRVLGFDALSAAEFKRWLEQELRLTRSARLGKEKVRRRVVSLLSLASSPNRYEAEAARTKAEEWMRLYNISLEDLSKRDRRKHT